jgi:hypothetical protein
MDLKNLLIKICQPMFVISKKKAWPLGKKSTGYPMDLEIYGQSIA